MNESHAGTEQATGWRRWIKRQIVKQFDAAFVGGEPHKRHFASMGIPADKIFTGYDAVDGDFFASRADEIRAEAKKSAQCSVLSVQQEEKADEVRTPSSQRSQSRGSKQQGRPETEHLPTLNPKSSTQQSLRSAYGLPQRYFLSLGRMVEKKNLSTLVEAYARFARASVERSKAKTGNLNRSGAEIAEGKPELPETAGGNATATSAENCKLKTEHCPPGLVFVGSGELENALREQARALGLRVVDRTGWGANKDKTKRLRDEETKGLERQAEPLNSQPSTLNEENCGTVFFYGFRQIEENPVFYALADAFILPSLKEEWGLVVNEAMACSLPVIVSRTAGCAEDLLPLSESVQCSVGSVQSGENAGSLNVQPSSINSLEERSNGLIFDPKSSDALSEALRRIADPLNPKRSTLNAAAMGQRSREIVANFSCENFARQALSAARAAQQA
jgi:glycosyltransferase involved in cell wall biosynthesis